MIGIEWCPCDQCNGAAPDDPEDYDPLDEGMWLIWDSSLPETAPWFGGSTGPWPGGQR